SGASVSKSVSLDKSGRMISSHVLNAGGRGRNLNLKGIETLLQESVPGLLVQFQIETEQLVEGVNVLTVVVIERGGNRHQQNVSFTASPESRTQIITPVVDIFHPETGKKVKTKLSLNGIMGKEDEKKKKNQKAVAIDTEITSKRLPVVSKETIEVIDERTHTVKTIEIKYKSNLERRKVLQDQKVANKKIKTTKIVYEKGQAVVAVAKKLNSMIPVTAKDFKTMNDEALKYLKEQNDRNFKDNNIG
ncbi:MAG TPA: hypothetical protein VNA26_02275, partial [Chitinophagaceae bacterium]|nr:hypothetical protein [Chitinophagaceae bacterium]